jgi:hypothetical protein
MMIRDLIRKSFLFDAAEPAYSRYQRLRWQRAGRPVPPPSAVKRQILRGYARSYGLQVLVETGTYRADTVRALRRDFSTIYSIELDPTLYAKALRRCRKQYNATLLQGDSAELLPQVLSELREPALFWLDAHFSSGVTASAEVETPILQELRAVLVHSVASHVVLIDDFREFISGGTDYPSFEILSELAGKHGYAVTAESDVIRLVRRTGMGPAD